MSNFYFTVSNYHIMQSGRCFYVCGTISYFGEGSYPVTIDNYFDQEGRKYLKMPKSKYSEPVSSINISYNYKPYKIYYGFDVVGYYTSSRMILELVLDHFAKKYNDIFYQGNYIHNELFLNRNKTRRTVGTSYPIEHISTQGKGFYYKVHKSLKYLLFAEIADNDFVNQRFICSYLNLKKYNKLTQTKRIDLSAKYLSNMYRFSMDYNFLSKYNY